MVEIIMLGVIIVLLIILIVARFRRSSEVRNLEKVVITKKLRLSEKLLDDQLKAPSGLMEMLQQGAGRETVAPQEGKEDRTPVGYARKS